MTADVEKAVQHVRKAWPDNVVIIKEDDGGGACVLVEALDLGEHFTPSTSWVAFHITHGYPDADVYPHFIDADVLYVGPGPADNQAPSGKLADSLPVPLTRGAVAPLFEKPAIQISRRTHGENIGTDTAANKLARILDLLRSL
jgi:hypothetical protein